MEKSNPIFKAEDNTNANNYRPISLLCNFNRIFEKLVYSRLESFNGQNDIFFSAQNGFHKVHSTQHAILDIVSTIRKTWTSACSYVVHLWTRKRLLIPSIIKLKILHKLDQYGFRGINKWFSYYLESRTQTMQIGSYISKSKKRHL